MAKRLTGLSWTRRAHCVVYKHKLYVIYVNINIKYTKETYSPYQYNNVVLSISPYSSVSKKDNVYAN